MGLYPPLPNFKKNLVYGGTAGLVGAVCMFPVDTAKTRVQNEKVAPGQKRMYENISSALRTIYRTQGLRGLYNGLQVTGRRAGGAGICAADGRKRTRALGEPQRKRASKGMGHTHAAAGGGVLGGTSSWMPTDPTLRRIPRLPSIPSLACSSLAC